MEGDSKEEHKEAEGKGEEGGGKKAKNKKLLWWGLGIGGAGLFVTLILFFKGSGGSTAGNVASGTGPVAAGYNPSDPYNQDYWPNAGTGATTVGNAPVSTPGGTTTVGTTANAGSNSSTDGGSAAGTSSSGSNQNNGNNNNQNNNQGNNNNNNNQPAKPNPIQAFVQSVFPAAAGNSTAGNKDTNWWSYTVGPNETVATVTSQVAKWGPDWQKLYGYRNNASIFGSQGVGYNPNAVIQQGTKISV